MVTVCAVNVIGYVRVSTDDQADSGAGLLAQRAAITEECRRRGWGLVAIHSDTASAANSRRPTGAKVNGSGQPQEASIWRNGQRSPRLGAKPAQV